MRNLYLLLCIMALSISAKAQTYELTIPESRYQIDAEHQLIVCNIDLQQVPDLTTYDEVHLALEAAYDFTANPGTLSTQESYMVEKGGLSYQLYFSVFPLISITTDFEIIDEPKRLASFVYADLESVQTSLVGIELRGGVSQTYPKKTYDLEFWEDENGDENRDMQFGDLRNDDDWILDALYNEPLRLRALSSHQLWLDMHTPYYIDLEEGAKAGADVRYAEMFLNNEYIGVYMLSEQVDKKQLKLKGYNGNIRGELYKSESWAYGNSNFVELPSFDNTSEYWGDYELKLPDGDDAIDWQNLYEFTDFVINSDETDFNTELPEKLNIDNAIDYFIFLNLTRATDNTGKNIYTAKYKQGEPYFFVPWDLDGVFGTIWNGENENITNDILSNGLFDRLIVQNPSGPIAQMTSARWFELRDGVLSNQDLQSRLDGNYNLLKDNLLYARENLVWQNYPYDEASKNYMNDWLTNRLEYLDIYFGDFLNVKTSDFRTIALYPNPTRDFIFIAGDLKKETPYEIYDLQGRLVLDGTLAPRSTFIDLTSLAPGMFVLKFDQTIQEIIKR